MTASTLIVRQLERVDYAPCWQAMKSFTDTRLADTADELWVVEHPPVFTLGQAGRPEHVLAPGEIPLVRCDRGGQVTYHGPGQTVLYLMLDLVRMGLGARALVTAIEQAIISVLADLDVTAVSRPDAPGVYVDGAKIASLGLRIRHGRSYHGLALNRHMDLSPFQRINPCGHAGQPMTGLAQLGRSCDRDDVEQRLIRALQRQLPLPDTLVRVHDLPRPVPESDPQATASPVPAAKELP